MFSTVWLAVIFTLAGAAVGSFLNVCIHRIPEGLSIVSPPSRCPRCGRSIRFYDNIPIVSYLILKGRCRDCRERISPRYPLVEALTALVAWLLFGKFGLTPAYFATFVFICSLIVIAFIDLDHQLIPHAITLSGIPVFSFMAVFFTGLPFVDSFLGIMIGAGTLYFVAVYYEALTKREGMGGGDVNLFAMIGAFLGWKALLFILLAGSLLGAAVGLAVIASKGKDMKYAIPFGPFLCSAAFLHLFFGNYLIGLLLSLRT
ncbi:MAG: prepilin peptidase [Proteobacteria bacterium]|nr:prepilin peptidase [Pseudomonadota bacterium]MBU2227908.1 prepilin peptidase [Pseudomonadota bacterium]MBU2262080.1 prepilin peptidase [Pseudomonadota bacterium]